jgi:hypothetical protein
MNIERIFATAVIVSAAVVGLSALRPETALAVPVPGAIVVTTTPLPLDRDDPARNSVGALRFLGAVQIRSTNRLFGGWSALRAGTGDRMLSVSDTGNWLAFRTIERDGRLVGVTDAVMTPIMQPDGKPAATKDAGDAEALEFDPATGDATIVYEQDHRLVHFTGIDADRPASLSAVPVRTERLTAMTGWPSNGGGEAMAVLPARNGHSARIVISETARRPDGSAPALLTIDGQTTEIGITVIADHSPTDAIALDDHRILVLNRRFSLSGQGAAIAIVDLSPALDGTALSAPLPMRILGRLERPLTFDNMEGLAIRRSGGHVFVYLISDDNLNSLQRTLLMKFQLPDEL